MQPITDNAALDKIPAIFQLGFRIFFLSGSLFAVISLFLWGSQLFHVVAIRPFGGSYWWHSHEMVFGFSTAIIAGFLLTAVQTWTGIPSIKGRNLSLLFVVWLSARLLLLFPGAIPQTVISVIDLAFLPLVAFALGYPIIRIKQWRNLVFIPILLLLFIENFIAHRGLWIEQPTMTRDAIWAAVLTVILLISIMGGRVIPFFTARATGTEQPSAIRILELGANIPVLMLIVYFLAGQSEAVTNTVLVAISSIGFLFQLVRTLRWQTVLTFKEPLLWSLHFSYLFIPLGLALLALHYAGLDVTASQALHSFTVGTIGGLILAMISRVSLGHTGRKLQTLSAMRWAFALMIAAGLIRSPLSAFQILSPTISLTLSFTFFIVAYAIFLWRYIPILSKRRIDGRPG